MEITESDDRYLVFFELVRRAKLEGVEAPIAALRVVGTSRELATIQHGDVIRVDGDYWKVLARNVDKKCFFLSPGFQPELESIYPTPENFRNIIRVITDESDEHTLTGRIVCTCGNANLVPTYAGNPISHRGYDIIQELETGNGNFLVIGASCINCQNDHLLFDADYHGYAGYLDQNAGKYRERLRPELERWHCPKCRSTNHRVVVTIRGDLKWALDESDGELSDEDCHEAYYGIDIDTECTRCGHAPEAWFGHEPKNSIHG